MKSTTAYYLLLLYTLALCKPMLPLVHDHLAHVFWAADHIATIHHQHGDHHAHEDVARAAHEEQEGNSSAAPKIFDEVAAHIGVESLQMLHYRYLEKQIFATTTSYSSATFLDTNYPPPKHYSCPGI